MVLFVPSDESICHFLIGESRRKLIISERNLLIHPAVTDEEKVIPCLIMIVAEAVEMPSRSRWCGVNRNTVLEHTTLIHDVQFLERRRVGNLPSESILDVRSQ